VTRVVTTEKSASAVQNSENWEVDQFSTSQHEDSFQLEYEVVNSVRSELVTRQGARKQEYKESSCEELTQCDYNEIDFCD
jgi:hypothetical protein